jgi:hypothetical protein
MRRRVLNILCALSIIFFLVLLTFWFRSYLPRNWRIDMVRGQMIITFWEVAYLTSSPIVPDVYHPAHIDFAGPVFLRQDMNKESELHFLGFSSTSGNLFSGMGIHIIIIPFWFLLLASGIASALLILAQRRLVLRSRLGHCQSCGYDLRHSKKNCPECGAPIPAAAQSH